MSLENQQQPFFKTYNIDEKEFNEAGLVWPEVIQIYKDYLEFIPTLKAATSPLLSILQSHPDVHSVRTRVKNPEHLVEKIIRKTISKKKQNPDYKITVGNYRTEVTDLLGIRVLHLYKDQAIHIDKKIRATWNLHERAKIYFRKGDYNDAEIREYSEHFDFEEHPAGYRSWHYLIESQITKEMTIAEIQVRTIFEEGWSEVDHQLRYPYDLENDLLTKQLMVLNRLAGNADEMVNSIRDTKTNLHELLEERRKQEGIIHDLSNELKDLKNELEEVYHKKEIQEDDLNSLQKKIKSLEDSQKKLTYYDFTLSGKAAGGSDGMNLSEVENGDSISKYGKTVKGVEQIQLTSEELKLHKPMGPSKGV
ncbi:hypothetical protein [Neobacillus niacini]|uniref:hypothetical protein n=1 Tax=Neobacillus niacini TaxID=86668 RepID=UPI0028545D7E|nr:hypothetical protein [Neobacillus niacini]MDR7002828.1 ppGpp synthetase/RelA/SpoT-type nucleotidyltransferase [Neobacillus niacini]